MPHAPLLPQRLNAAQQCSAINASIAHIQQPLEVGQTRGLCRHTGTPASASSRAEPIKRHTMPDTAHPLSPTHMHDMTCKDRWDRSLTSAEYLTSPVAPSSWPTTHHLDCYSHNPPRIAGRAHRRARAESSRLFYLPAPAIALAPAPSIPFISC